MAQKTVDIRALADLARVAISDEEVKSLETQIPAILDFVAEIQAVSVGDVVAEHELVNVFRADENPHESGIYTKVLLDAAPAQENGYVKVRQVLKGGKHAE